MKLIPLTQGKFAKVDDEDYKELAKHKWRYDPNGYAVREVDGGQQYMHRVINQTPKGVLTDHINTDKLDNRRSNLRACTHSQNHGHTPILKNNTSGYKGVTKSKNKWEAKIWKDNIGYRLGRFVTPEDAAHAYDQKAKELFGEFAITNF